MCEPNHSPGPPPFRCPRRCPDSVPGCASPWEIRLDPSAVGAGAQVEPAGRRQRQCSGLRRLLPLLPGALGRANTKRALAPLGRLISGAPACPLCFPRAPVSARAALGRCWSRRLLSLGAVGASRFRVSGRSRFPGPRANLDEQIPKLSRRERRHPGVCDVCWPLDSHCRPDRAGAGSTAELTEIAPFTARARDRGRRTLWPVASVRPTRERVQDGLVEFQQRLVTGRRIVTARGRAPSRRASGMDDETRGDTVRSRTRSSTAWRSTGQAGSGFSCPEHAPSVPAALSRTARLTLDASVR